MKILVIASDIGATAPGIVYETLLSSLVDRYEVYLVSLITPNNVEGPIFRNLIQSKRPPFIHYGIEKESIKLFGRNILDDIYMCHNLLTTDYSIIKEIDLIVSFASFHHYIPTILGSKLSKKYNKKWLIYSVDAIPAPFGWIDDLKYYKRCSSFIGKYISRADAFLSSNPQMLEYQIGKLIKKPKVTGVLYTPIRRIISVEKRNTDHVNLLYTGGIYGPRKKESVLDGFRLFLKKQPDATFTFVGAFSPENFRGYEDLLESGNIILAGYTTNLQPYYENATILIDINAYFENDVFLSSKIVNYLPIERPIISVTGANSPSRNLFTDDPTIVHCSHNAQEIYEAIITALTLDIDYSKREMYVEMLSIDTQIKVFEKNVNSLISVREL